MKTVNIKGKEYVTVNERLKYFRKTFEGYGLLSELISNEGGVCVFRATIYNEKREPVATGYSQEKELDKSSFVNKTSYIENSETSAWGRALGNFGIGIDTSVASADEVANAIKQQNNGKVSPPVTRELKKEITACEKLADLKKIRETMNDDERKIYSKLIEGRAYDIRLKMMDENFGKELNKLTKANFQKNYLNIETAIEKAKSEDKETMIKMYEHKIKEIGIDHQFESLPF